MKKFFIICSALAVMLSTACTKEENEAPLRKVRPGSGSVSTDSSSTDSSNTGCQPVSVEFLAGQHHLSGHINVSNDGTNLYVTFDLDGWQMHESHLYVGPYTGLPKSKNGNPKIGNFPYKAVHSPEVSEYTYTIPLSNFEGQSCIIVAAHAAVHQLDENGNAFNGQTAWGAGNQIAASGSWAQYFNYCICEGGNSNGSTSGGTTSGSTGGSTGTTTSGTTSGSTDGSTGSTSGSTGSTSGSTSGSTDGSTSGSTSGSTDGSTSGSTSGSTDGTTSGTSGSTDGTSTSGTTDGSTNGGMIEN